MARMLAIVQQLKFLDRLNIDQLRSVADEFLFTESHSITKAKEEILLDRADLEGKDVYWNVVGTDKRYNYYKYPPKHMKIYFIAGSEQEVADRLATFSVLTI
jgi:hypothetical protein